MRCLQLPDPIVAFAATNAVTANPVPSVPPRFETLFFGSLELGKEERLNVPFGTRGNLPIKGLNLTDPSGNMVATLVSSTADTGPSSSWEIDYPHVVFVMRSEIDHKLVFLFVNGVGRLFSSTDLSYIHVETDSETYKSLNGRFLIGNGSLPDGGDSSPIFTIFGAF